MSMHEEVLQKRGFKAVQTKPDGVKVFTNNTHGKFEGHAVAIHPKKGWKHFSGGRLVNGGASHQELAKHLVGHFGGLSSQHDESEPEAVTLQPSHDYLHSASYVGAPMSTVRQPEPTTQHDELSVGDIVHHARNPRKKGKVIRVKNGQHRVKWHDGTEYDHGSTELTKIPKSAIR